MRYSHYESLDADADADSPAVSNPNDAE